MKDLLPKGISNSKIVAIGKVNVVYQAVTQESMEEINLASYTATKQVLVATKTK